MPFNSAVANRTRREPSKIRAVRKQIKTFFVGGRYVWGGGSSLVKPLNSNSLYVIERLFFLKYGINHITVLQWFPNETIFPMVSINRTETTQHGLFF